jgi:hypothetical protein
MGFKNHLLLGNGRNGKIQFSLEDITDDKSRPYREIWAKQLAPFPIELIITTLFGLLMPPPGYLLYRRAENSARKHGSLST